MNERVTKEPTVKLTHSIVALAACAALALPAAAAEGAKLKIPDFSHLRARAIDSEDITIDGFLLRLARKFAADDGDDGDEIAILRDIKSVRVRNFEFATEGEYSREDIESVRKQLAGPGWSALVQAHKRDPQEDVDVFINTDGDKILGLAVIASEPREFTIVNIVGNIDVDKFAKLEGQFGIPRVDTNE
jgi:hypothetical protein